MMNKKRKNIMINFYKIEALERVSEYQRFDGWFNVRLIGNWGIKI